MATVSIRDLIAPHFWNTFNSKKPHQIYAGGRASTKTSQLAIKIDEFNLEYTECNAIIIKRYQNTIRNSVFKEIKRALIRYKSKNFDEKIQKNIDELIGLDLVVKLDDGSYERKL